MLESKSLHGSSVRDEEENDKSRQSPPFRRAVGLQQDSSNAGLNAEGFQFLSLSANPRPIRVGLFDLLPLAAPGFPFVALLSMSVGEGRGDINKYRTTAFPYGAQSSVNSFSACRN